MNKRLLLVFFALTPACVFTDLSELPPPISVVNNMEPDLTEDVSGDMAVPDMAEACELMPTTLTTDTITHFAADRFVDVVFYAARLSTGAIQLGRIDGDNVTNNFATPDLPGTGVHSISVAAVSEDRMIFAVLRDVTRVVNVWSCTTEGCTSFGTTGLQGVVEMQLASATTPMLGYVRGLPPNQEFVAQGIDLNMNSIIPGLALRATIPAGVAGVSFASAAGSDFRVAFGSPLRGFQTAVGTGELEPERCLTFEKRMMDPYFTRVKRLSEFFLLRADDGLYLTDCSASLQLTNRHPIDSDFVPLTGTQAFAVWPEAIDGRVRGALIEGGAIVRTVDLGEWDDVSHIRAFRTQTELLVFFGGEGTHLQLFKESGEDLVTCFRND